MKISVTVCDVCQDKTQPTKRFEIREGGRKAAVDLCAAHGEPFEAHLGKTAKKAAAAPQKRTQARRSPRSRVVSIEEIEAQKSK